MRIKGQWFDGRRAAGQACSLWVSQGRARLEPPLCTACAIADLAVSAPLGNTPRYVTFPDGSLFETADSAALDAMLAMQADGAPMHDRLQQQVHRLESHWPVALLCLVLLATSLWLFAVRAMPLLAETVAMRLPPAVSSYIGRDTLVMLDRMGLQPSSLPPERQQQLQALFAGLLPPATTGGLTFRLEHRRGAKAGANAFALPDATIVVTDELVALAQSDQEIAIVLLHEIGHVQHRHLLRQLLQQAGLAAMLAAVAGDITGASEFVLAMPGLLAQAHYSQAMELEADRYARERLADHGLPVGAFGAFMQRLEASRPDGAEWRYLSTHPQTAERIRAFEQPGADY
jgi:Zn-dependent protease with chaperone function